MRNSIVIILIVCLTLFAKAQTLIGPGNLINSGVAGFSSQLYDIDGDGDLDATVVKSGNLVWFANNGSGNFNAPQTIVASSSIHYKFSDLNSDGTLDLVYYNNTQLNWMANNGSGSFSAPTLIANIPNLVASTFQSLLEAGDLDNDGDNDVILVTNPDNIDESDDDILIYRNNGLGVFTNIFTINTGEDYIRDIQLGDISGNGFRDIVFIAEEDFGTFLGISTFTKYYRNNGNYTFTLQLAATGYGGGESNCNIDLADVDLDGDLDILANYAGTVTAKVYINAAGNINNFITLQGNDGGPTAAKFVHLNNDAFPDVVVGYNEYSASVFYNLNNNSFTGRQPICDDDEFVFQIAVGDIDSDGDKDILAAKFFANDLYWIENIPMKANIATINLPCSNSCNGTVLVEICNPIFPPITYSWEQDGGALTGSGTSSSELFTISGLCAGSIDFTITDAFGNVYIETGFAFSEQLGAYFEIIGVNVTNTSNGQSNGDIEILINGGSPNYTFSWTGPTSGSINTSNENYTISNITAGNYVIAVSENLGATATINVTVLDEDQPVSTCNQPLDVIILNDVSGSVDGIEYLESKQFFVDLINALNIGTTINDSRVAIIEWSSTGEQNIVQPITGNLAQLQGYVNASRTYSGGTNPQDALTFGKNYLDGVLRNNISGVLVLSTDANDGQVSGSLIALANAYKAQGYFIVTIAFDEAFSSGFVRAVLQQAASADVLVYGAPSYAELTNDIAETIVNLYVCPVGPGTSNSVFFNRDGLLDITSISANGFCPDPTSISVNLTITAQQQLALPVGTPITFYYNNPELFGATPILTYALPCAIPAGNSENLTIVLPVNNPANIYAVLNDDGSQAPPISFPITGINESIYLNNIDNASICTEPIGTVSALKYTTTPIPVCDSVVVYVVDVCNISNTQVNNVLVKDIPPTGSILENRSINLNSCASQINDSTFTLPQSCCASIIYTYNIANVSPGLYSNQDVDVSGPSGQTYIDFDGTTTAAEDVLIGALNCVSNIVLFSKSTNVTEICEESFVTYTFTIDNQTNVELLNLNFSDILPSPVIWAAEPYNLNGLSIGESNITGSNSAIFTIDIVEASTLATFQMDVYLGNWVNSGTLTNTASIDDLPGFVNENAQTATANTVNVYVLPTIDAVNLVQINSDETALLESTITNGINPIWTTSGDGYFIDAQLEDVVYIPGPQDIETGVVNFTITAQSPLASCGDAFDTVRLEITKVYDFGDAPNIYKTLNSANGAKHFLTYTQKNALFLGSNNADDETDGLPVTAGQTATRDDNQNVDDENGVAAFPTLSNDMTGTYSIEIQAQNFLSTNARLLGWIDFNKDGIWASSESEVLNITAGTSLQNYTLNFTLPAVLDTGITYARFRIMTDNLSDNGGTPIDERSFGLVNNGEVEDYEVYIIATEICDNSIDDDGDGDIDAADTDCQSCRAQFSPSSFCFGNATNFDGSASFASPQATITSYYWDFGDGNTSSNPIVDLATHTYSLAGTYDVLLIIEDDSSCVDSITQSITIHPLPNVQISAIANVCLNAAPFTLTQGSPVGGSYLGIGVSGTTFNPTLAGVGSHPILYIFNDGNGCSDTVTTTITVNEIPSVNLSPFADVCASSPTFTLTGGSPAGGSYSGIGIVGNTFDPAIAGEGSFDIQYVFSANGCSDTANQTIVVNANPVASISAIPDICILAGNLTLTQGSPAGGNYSGIGVSGTTFDPSIAGVGTHTIFYVFSDGNGCVDSASTSVVVYDISGITINPIADVCLNEAPFVLTQGSPAGGIYQGNGVINDSIFNPQTAGVGSHTIQYIFNDGNGCSDTVSATITVLVAPSVSFNPLNDICINDGSITLSGVNPSGGMFEGTGVIGNTFDPSVAGSGTFNIEYIYTDGNGCADSAVQTITVLEPGIDTSEIYICEGTSYTLGNGQILTDEGHYPDTLSNTGTCEVIEVTHVIIEAGSIDSVYGLVCVGDTYELPNGAFVSQPGMYLDTLAGFNDCDSIIVTILGLDENGCIEECFLTAPTAFTPDNDNMNDVFYIINTCAETLITFELTIYNRWGELIYSSNNISEGWDGKVAGKNAELDVYIYIVNFRRQNVVEDERLSGIVLLLR
jgi:gliding motility-associated-like protein/uncharacterized repeat protein (TIGR01451 family)